MPDALRGMMRGASGARARGRLEVDLTRFFLGYAFNIGTSIFDPGAFVSVIKRDRPTGRAMSE